MVKGCTHIPKGHYKYPAGSKSNSAPSVGYSQVQAMLLTLKGPEWPVTPGAN